MSIMKSLTFTAVPKIQNDPARTRRERLVSRLQEQKELVANPSLIRTVQRTVKKDGLKTVVETPKDRPGGERTRRARSFFVSPRGGVGMRTRYRARHDLHRARRQGGVRRRGYGAASERIISSGQPAFAVIELTGKARSISLVPGDGEAARFDPNRLRL